MIDFSPKVAEIAVGKGKYAIVDAFDLPLIEAYSRDWRLTGKGYVFCTAKVDDRPKTVMLHRLIMGFPPFQVDHHDRNKLNNRRCNLRLCTNAQNQGNRLKQRRPATSKFKGVDFRQRTNRYRAQIHRYGKLVVLGEFASEEEAARAYDSAAREHFGAFARVNFPVNGEACALREAAETSAT